MAACVDYHRQKFTDLCSSLYHLSRFSKTAYGLIRLATNSGSLLLLPLPAMTTQHKIYLSCVFFMYTRAYADLATFYS